MLAQEGCLKTIKLNVLMPTKMNVEDWDDLKTKVAGTIWLFLSNQVMYHVIDKTSPEKI